MKYCDCTAECPRTVWIEDGSYTLYVPAVSSTAKPGTMCKKQSKVGLNIISTGIQVKPYSRL